MRASCVQASIPPRLTSSIFQDAPDDDAISTITSLAPLVDRKLTYQKLVNPCEEYQSGSAVHLHQGVLSDDLLELAHMSGAFSRFDLDPRFHPWFEKLYTTWIAGCLAGRPSDAVFVTGTSARITGFATLSHSQGEGKIGLIAVHPDVRGMGLGTALLNEADHWFSERKCSHATVVTQRANLPACRLYERNGYTVAQESRSLSLLGTSREMNRFTFVDFAATHSSQIHADT